MLDANPAVHLDEVPEVVVEVESQPLMPESEYQPLIDAMYDVCWWRAWGVWQPEDFVGTHEQLGGARWLQYQQPDKDALVGDVHVSESRFGHLGLERDDIIALLRQHPAEDRPEDEALTAQLELVTQEAIRRAKVREVVTASGVAYTFIRQTTAMPEAMYEMLRERVREHVEARHEPDDATLRLAHIDELPLDADMCLRFLHAAHDHDDLLIPYGMEMACVAFKFVQHPLWRMNEVGAHASKKRDRPEQGGAGAEKRKKRAARAHREKQELSADDYASFLRLTELTFDHESRALLAQPFEKQRLPFRTDRAREAWVTLGVRIGAVTRITNDPNLTRHYTLTSSGADMLADLLNGLQLQLPFETRTRGLVRSRSPYPVAGWKKQPKNDKREDAMAQAQDGADVAVPTVAVVPADEPKPKHPRGMLLVLAERFDTMFALLPPGRTFTTPDAHKALAGPEKPHKDKHVVDNFLCSQSKLGGMLIRTGKPRHWVYQWDPERVQEVEATLSAAGVPRKAGRDVPAASPPAAASNGEFPLSVPDDIELHHMVRQGLNRTLQLLHETGAEATFTRVEIEHTKFAVGMNYFALQAHLVRLHEVGWIIKVSPDVKMKKTTQLRWNLEAIRAVLRGNEAKKKVPAPAKKHTTVVTVDLPKKPATKVAQKKPSQQMLVENKYSELVRHMAERLLRELQALPPEVQADILEAAIDLAITPK